MANDPCDNVKAGSIVTSWRGALTDAQCSRFPPGKRLGQGSFATAYVKADEPDKVVKFTADPEDAKASRKLIGKKLRGAVEIYDVAELRGQAVDIPMFKKYDRIYGITTQRVEPLPRKMLPAASGTLSLPVSFDVALQRCRDMSRKLNQPDSECDVTLPKMKAAIDELRAEGIDAEDTHGGNWGLRNGEPVLLDLGVSAIDPATVPPIDLAAIRKGEKKMRRMQRDAAIRYSKEAKMFVVRIPGSFTKAEYASTRQEAEQIKRRMEAVLKASKQPFRGNGLSGIYDNPKNVIMLALGIGVVAYLLWPKKAKAEKKAPPAATPTPAPAAGGTEPVGSFRDPATGVVIEGPKGDIGVGIAYTVQRGESWSNIASRVFGDYRWWPFLWDYNRGNGTQFPNPDMLKVGDSISIPAATPADAAYRAAIFERALAHRQYWVDKAAGKAAGAMPDIVYKQTPRS